jgi:hypothetical protein
MKQVVIDCLRESIERQDKIISHLRAEIGRYTEQLDRANKAMERWTPAMGRNGRMDVGGLVEMLVAEIKRKDTEIDMVWVYGVKAGWNYGVVKNIDGLNNCIENRLKEKRALSTEEVVRDDS